MWSGATLGVASDRGQRFFVDAKDGHLWGAQGDAPPAVVASQFVPAADRVAWGWLSIDRGHAYWTPGQMVGQRSGERQILRVPRQGGPVQPGFQPKGPVVAVQIDDAGGLLLTEEGLWSLDLRDWGKARLLRPGHFSSLAADGRRVYLRPVRDAVPMDLVAKQVVGENRCFEPRGTRVVVIDRQSGAETPFFDGGDLTLFGPLVQDETHLFVAATETSLLADLRSCQVRTLLRISKDGGASQARRLPVGLGGDLVAVGAHLYWIDAISGRVFTTPKGGGPISVLAQLPCRPNRLAAVGGGLELWKGDGGSCPLTRVALDRPVAAAAANLDPGDALLAVGSGWAYVADADDRLRRISLARGTVEPVRGKDGVQVVATQGAVIGEALFFLAPDFLGRWSPDAGEVVRVYEGRVRALASEGDDLYVATHDGTIATLGKSGGARTVILGTGASVRDLAALGAAVYWIEGPPRGGGRALWTSAAEGARTQLMAVDGMDQIASDGRAIYYATEGRSRILPTDSERSGAIVRFAGGRVAEIAGRQETVTDLRASPHGVFWRQRRGVRRLDAAGALTAVDCTVADQGVGLAEADGFLYWTDATARALMVARVR